MTVVVYDAETKEILAAIPLEDKKTAVVKKGVQFKLFKGTEPTFQNQDGVLTVNENTFIVNMSDIV